MTKKTFGKKIMFAFLLSLAVLLTIYGAVGSVASFNGQPLSLDIGTQIFVPQFSSISCEKTDKPVDPLKFSIADGQNYLDVPCSASPDHVYTNKCEVSLQTPSWWFGADYYVCPASETDVTKCQKIGGVTNQASVAPGLTEITRDQVLRVRNIHVGLFGLGGIKAGDLVAFSRRDEYGLVNNNEGFLVKENSCDLKDIFIGQNTDVLTSALDKASSDGRVIGTTLGFGQVINYVSSFGGKVSSLNIIDNGQFYSIGNGVKYPIVVGSSGNKYVDLTNPTLDSTLICNPALPYCSNDGRKINEDFGAQKVCNPATDLIPGFVPSSSASNTVCQRTCSTAGQWVESGCKSIPKCTPDKPVLDSDYNCVAGTFRTSTSSSGSPDFIPLFALGFGLAATFAIAKNKDKLRGK